MPGDLINWDIGTAYDLFVSLEVLHNPADYDLRLSWAAGLRARIPAPQRQILEDSQLLLCVPLAWIYSLPEPKDTQVVLDRLRLLSPAERLPALALEPGWPPEHHQVLLEIAETRRYRDKDREILAGIYQGEFQVAGKKPLSRPNLQKILDWWTRPEEFGQLFLEALSIYADEFYFQEERRIFPIIQSAFVHAQERARHQDLVELIEELSQGVRFAPLPAGQQAVLVPSYWSTPIVFFAKLDPLRTIYLFGARPPDDPFIPGQTVPDALMRLLKALADPTRLQILQYLTDKPHTLTELARLLRLRPPTIVHHLHILRLAGLVRLTLDKETVTRHYSARQEAIDLAYQLTRKYISQGKE
jgi:DNA-binding transcriptional ArsR family regulator